MMRDFQRPGRSPVMAPRGMAATSHPLATATAVDVLRRGGNAIDAAIAAAAVLTVVEPHMTGLGGDGFAVIAEPDGSVHGYNGSGRAPQAADLDFFRERNIAAIDEDSVHAVTVPGVVATWEAIQLAHGRWSFADLLQDAITYAENGYPVAPRVAHDWAGHTARLARDEGAQRHYLIDGRAPVAGEIHRVPALARTLREIAKSGAKAFYSGAIAEEIVATVKGYGGLLALDDLAAVEVTPVAPVISGYRGLDVAELPPNGQGIVALILLNVLEGFELAGLDPNGAERLHLEIEAARFAYACRDAGIGDPAAMTVAVEDLVAKAFAQQAARRIDRKHRTESLAPVLSAIGSDTVYLTVVDEDLRAVSLINSIYGGFGTGIVTPEWGVTLQNRGASFTLQPGHPNVIGPGKRPMHTIIPAMAFRDGLPAISFGVMGGGYQPCGHAHFVSNVVDFGMDVQQAIDAPRVFWDGDGRIGAEAGISEETVNALGQMGHVV
ncbi:MAG: gamma-glutamyltransferase, partial [Hyphomicrobiales bacterium]|nr:gamma-glutamyltransferase [Hyphomicrobiales bacterium]